MSSQGGKLVLAARNLNGTILRLTSLECQFLSWGTLLSLLLPTHAMLPEGCFGYLLMSSLKCSFILQVSAALLQRATLLFVVNIVYVYMRWILPAKPLPSIHFSLEFPLWNKGTAVMRNNSAGTFCQWICYYCLCSPEQALGESTPLAVYGFEYGYLSYTSSIRKQYSPLRKVSCKGKEPSH